LLAVRAAVTFQPVRRRQGFTGHRHPWRGWPSGRRWPFNRYDVGSGSKVTATLARVAGHTVGRWLSNHCGDWHGWKVTAARAGPGQPQQGGPGRSVTERLPLESLRQRGLVTQAVRRATCGDSRVVV